MAKSGTPKPVEDLMYEEALAELEKIVASLEQEQISLADAMTLFERGQALVTRCGSLLEAAELKVQQLTGETVGPFDEEKEES